MTAVNSNDTNRSRQEAQPLQEVAAYLRGVADATAVFNAALPRAEVGFEARTFARADAIRDQLASIGDLEDLERPAGVSIDWPLEALAPLSLLPMSSGRETVPYGVPLASFSPSGGSRSLGPWVGSGGTRQFEPDGASISMVPRGFASERTTLACPPVARLAVVPPCATARDSAPVPEDPWVDERQSGVHLRAPHLPVGWYALTGTDDPR